MGIYAQTRLGELYKLIAKDNPQLAFPPDESSTTVTGIAVNAGTKNTKATLTGIKYKGYRGSQTLYYNRIDLATLFLNSKAQVTVPPDASKTISGILPWINSQLGLYFEAGDYSDAILVLDSATGLYKATLATNANNPLYIGSLDLQVAGFALDLGVIVSTKELSVCVDNSVHVAGKYCQTLLTYGVDYSAIAGFLATLPNPKASTTLPDATAKALARQLRSIGDQPWVWDSTANRDFNLRGASIYWNDSPSDQYAGSALNPAPNFSYDRVAIIQLNSTYNLNIAPGGNGWWLFLHYDLVEV